MPEVGKESRESNSVTKKKWAIVHITATHWKPNYV